MGIFGWSYPPGCSGVPDDDKDRETACYFEEDFFGSLVPLSGEMGSGVCCVCGHAGCVQRSTQTTAYCLCGEHARAWDEGRVVGSLVAGMRVVPRTAGEPGGAR